MGRKRTSTTYSDPCYLTAREVFSEELISDADLKRITEDINKKAKEWGLDDGDKVAFRSKQHRLRAMLVMDKKVAVRQRARRLMAERKVKRFVSDPAYAGDPMKAFYAKFEYIPDNVKGSHEGFFINQETNSRIFGRALDSLGEDAEILRTGKLDSEIADGVYRLNRGEDVSHLRPESVRIAKKLRQYNKYLYNYMRAAGVDIKHRNDYIVRQTHDWEKISEAGFEEWKDFIGPKLDEEATFQDIVDVTEREKILNSIYEDITAGSYGNSVGGFGGQRTLIFKDGVAFSLYNNRFGRDNLMETVINTSRNSARVAALAQTFGDTDIERLWKMMEEETFKKLNKDQRVQFTRGAERRKQMLDIMLGRTSDGPSEMLAKVTRGTLSVQRMALLNNVAISTLPDLATTVGNIISATGMPRFQAYAEAVSTFVNSIPTENRKMWLSYFEESIDSLIESNYQRFGLLGEGNSKFFRSAEEKYFRLVGLTQQTQAAKLANKRIFSRILGDIKGTSFKEMSPRMKATLDRVGITEADWKVMSNYAREVEGKTYILPSDMPSMELKQKLSKYFIAMAKGGVIEGGALHHLQLTGARGAGDPIGAGLRLLTQFMSFSLAIPRTLKQMNANAMNADVLFKAFGVNVSKNVMRTAVDGMILGMMVQYINDLAKNKNPDLTNPEAMKNLALRGMQRGALPILGQYFIDAAQGDMSLERLAGPTFSQIPAVGKIVSTTFEGDIGEALARTGKQISRNIPLQNSILMRPVFNKLFLDSLNEVISPGYKERMEKRAKKEGYDSVIDF